ncbi:MAG: MoaD/ThiS family protein [Thaumarchaeota archaeon]|nr:MoaD/ThiS family protein [Nitrososphaerota archaeon]
MSKQVSKENIRIKVKYLGLAKSYLRSPGEEVEVHRGSTVRKLIYTLGEKHGDIFLDNVMSPQGDIRGDAKVLVDGKNIFELSGLDTDLKDGHNVLILVIYP